MSVDQDKHPEPKSRKSKSKPKPKPKQNQKAEAKAVIPNYNRELLKYFLVAIILGFIVFLPSHSQPQKSTTGVAIFTGHQFLNEQDETQLLQVEQQLAGQSIPTFRLHKNEGHHKHSEYAKNWEQFSRRASSVRVWLVISEEKLKDARALPIDKLLSQFIGILPGIEDYCDYVDFVVMGPSWAVKLEQLLREYFNHLKRVQASNPKISIHMKIVVDLLANQNAFFVKSTNLTEYLQNKPVLPANFLDLDQNRQHSLLNSLERNAGSILNVFQQRLKNLVVQMSSVAQNSAQEMRLYSLWESCQESYFRPQKIVQILSQVDVSWRPTVHSIYSHGNSTLKEHFTSAIASNVIDLGAEIALNHCRKPNAEAINIVQGKALIPIKHSCSVLRHVFCGGASGSSADQDQCTDFLNQRFVDKLFRQTRPLQDNLQL